METWEKRTIPVILASDHKKITAGLRLVLDQITRIFRKNNQIKIWRQDSFEKNCLQVAYRHLIFRLQQNIGEKIGKKLKRVKLQQLISEKEEIQKLH
jgi:hypothetical protein